ncbi:acyl-coenzyme A thioesterase 9, mitochondrial [Exaiptasia diaphana]|uniref:HotDog ACOT-type domain-containing protein n=1 Tax=Exaiptasia diaphana TaxID=2652724 RepID=A0A913XHH1_EXADI|nr:acyl-coenzyme A thioesterase 9, mitochondrial [Exaiptasia diaphana]
MKEIKYNLRTMVGGQSPYWSGETTKPDDFPDLEQPDTQEELPARTMKDSYQEAYLPVGTDLKLREKYQNFYKFIRFGKILANLDMFAAWISYLHIHGGQQNLKGTSPHTVVTALVDIIDLYEQIQTYYDIKMSGNVTWVGKSSMEVTMDLGQIVNGSFKHILDARFLMVSRDIKRERAALVNPLVLKTDKEKQIFQQGQENHSKSLATWSTSLTKTAPTAEESQIVHDLMLQTGVFDASVKKSPSKMDNTVFMEDTELSSVYFCNPQQRNTHNKVFGGFLLDRAFGLAWTNACLFSGGKAIMKTMDDVRFRKGVEMGSILEFTSQVVYTPPQPTKRFQIMTVADVIQPSTGERETTNIFYYTFESENEVRSVAPRSYAEAMRYIAGKRRYVKCKT